MTAHPFDLGGPLPKGRVRLEASAGTGKTYTVAHLVARYVVEEGVPVGGLLVTTFTKAAAAELRERCRARLLNASATEVGERAERASRAVADFDQATMDTIHSVCQRLLRLAGRPVRIEDRPGRELALIDEVVNDWLVRHREDPGVPIDGKQLKRIAPAVRKALAFPNASIVARAEGTWGLLQQMVSECVRDVRARSGDAVSFDGLLYAAREVVKPRDKAAAQEAEAVCDRLRRRFPVAIVDEAQDTDPVQWEIMDALYPAGRSDGTLIMVGDPKQSIYGFRGADVRAFTSAGGRKFTLTDNYRSDQPLLDGLNVLLDGACFGGDITYLRVNAPPKHQHARLPAEIPVPLELVVAGTESGTDGDEVAAANHMAEAAAARVAHALAAADNTHPAGRFWDPGQVAVLVGSHAEGAAVASALRRRGIPCTTAGTTSVMESEGARQLRTLLGALAHPAQQARARLAAVGWFGRLDMHDLSTVTDDDLLDTQERLLQWGAQMRRHGVAAVIRKQVASASVLERVRAGGELPRHLTDMDHLAEVLHERTGRGGCTPAQAEAVLGELDQLEASNELVTRRLDTDAPVVQVTTIHAAKGLQWPCVVVARKWGTKPPSATHPPVVRRHSGDVRPELCVDWIADETPEDITTAIRDEWCEEQKRLFYVAVTRAESRLVLVLPAGAASASIGGGESSSDASDLLLHITDGRALCEALGARLQPLEGKVRIATYAEVMAEAPSASGVHADTPLQTLTVAPLPPGMRRVPREWSFTSISARGAHDPASGTAAEQGGLDEHGASDAVTADSDGPDAARENAPEEAPPPAPGPLADLPASAEVGVCLHAVFERADFTAPDLDAELRPLLARHAAVPALRDRHDALAQGLARVIDTPLGATVPGNPALRQLNRPHRLDELRFQLALAPHGRGAAIHELGALWADALSADDPLRPYARTLADGALTAWPSGYLVGAIDLVARLPQLHGETDTARYLVLDYKSNRLRDGYHHGALTRAMMAHHYPLQGLLYLVAVHRFLRWRTGAADPSPQLAGFAYLFVRGMVGADTPVDAAGRVQGVFHWTPPAGLVAEASALLARGAAEEVA